MVKAKDLRKFFLTSSVSFAGKANYINEKNTDNSDQL